MMQTVDVIHANGGFTTLRCPKPEAYGMTVAELSDDPTYKLESMTDRGVVFREVNEEVADDE